MDKKKPVFAQKKTELLTIRLDDETMQRLEKLHANWQVSRGEVLRRLLRMVS